MSTYSWNPYAFSAIGQVAPKPVVAESRSNTQSPDASTLTPIAERATPLPVQPGAQTLQMTPNTTLAPSNQVMLNIPTPNMEFVGGATLEDVDSANNSFAVRTPNGDSFHKQPRSPLSSAATTTSVSVTLSQGEENVVEEDAAVQIQEIISSLRKPKKDSAVPHAIRRLKKTLRADVFAAICSDEQLVIANCKQERGNLIAPVLNLVVSDEHRAELIAIIRRHFFDITTDRSGCVAMCRILDAADEATRLQLAELLLPHAGSLAMHIYGNYVVQHLLSECGEELCLRVVGSIIEQICHSGGIANFACSKFGSHVLEQAVGFAPPSQLSTVVRHTCAPGVVETLVNHRYGNYPLQAMLKTTSTKLPVEFALLRAAVVPHLHVSLYARKLVQSMQTTADVDSTLAPPTSA